MPKTLLLADDSVTIQKVVGISLASEDITLVAVDNGAAAVAKAKEIRPDLILADVVMPQLSGYEVCRQVKADPNLRHVPVLLLTGTFEAFDENKAREVGSDGHITKPFEAQALVELVNARLAAAAPPAPSAPAAAPAAKALAPDPIFGEDEPFDFMSEEITAPNPSGGAAPADDALSFGSRDELELSANDEIESDPLGDDAMTRVELAAEDSGVAMVEDDDENAETLPPMAAEALDDDDSPAATQVLFGEAPETPSEESNASTRVLLSEPEEAPAAPPLDAKEDLFADMIGGRAKADVTPTDLGDPFADDPEIAAPAASPPNATVVLSASREAWPADDEADAIEDAPAPLRAAGPAPRALSGDAAPSREELRAMLEKIAWEAFGDLTDRIVRETVQRVEQIAWEVIPKMAEALVREEIAKLKGDADE